MNKQLIKESPGVVQLDENQLDKECIRLPNDYLRYAHLAAEAKKDADEAKARLDVVKADLSSLIRKKPDKYGLEKPTESAINAAIEINDEYQQAIRELQTAKYHHDLAQSVVWALEHKKRSLTLLVELHGMGYFNEPKISKRGKEAVEEMTKREVRRRHQKDA